MSRDLMEVVSHLSALERRMDDLVLPEVGLPIAEDNVASPPTDAQLDTAFGTVYDGFMGLVDDNGAGTAVWLVVWVNGKWWYEELTAAV